MLKSLLRKISSNPLDKLLKNAQKKGSRRFLIGWNRGLGDIALGLYAIVHRIREFIPEAKVTFLTRENLREGFLLLGGIDILVDPNLKRGAPIDLKKSLFELCIDPSSFDELIENPDPTYWVQWQLGKLTPKLNWNPDWDSLWKKFPLQSEKIYVGAHIHCETSYATWRNWSIELWEQLFKKLLQKHQTKILLFGYEATPSFSMENIIDLRGKTNLVELLSIIKNCCRALIVPDSGISSMTYFLNESFPIQIISLWAETNMGILKQNVSSPNILLKHTPLIAPEKNILKIRPEDVEQALFL